VNYRPGIPRYLQIADAIRRDLRGDGERIDSEHALCARFKVSRPTVRQALDVLVQEGRLYRHAGRGTFSTAAPGGDSRLRVIGSVDDMIALGDETWFKLLSHETVPVPANIAQALRLPPGSTASRIIGVRHADSGPFQHVTAWLPSALTAKLSDEDLSKTSLIAAIERDLSHLEHLRAFALPVVSELDEWRGGSWRWGSWLDRLETLAPRVLRRPTRVLRVLAELRPMAEVGPVGIAEVRTVLSDRLRQLSVEPPPRRFGRVFVGSPEQARGRAFRVVCVPGLAERVFPQKLREDPLLLDAARQALGGRLPVRDDRALQERLQLRIALGAASDRLYLSYPRLDVNEARPRVPSFYALDVQRALTGRIPSHEALEREAYQRGGAALAWPAPASSMSKPVIRVRLRSCSIRPSSPQPS